MAELHIPPAFENEYYTTAQSPHEFFELGDFHLEEGGVIRDARLAYAAHGRLNEDKSNAILFPHMFSGTHMDMERYVGPGLALDPEKYFIILPDQLGGGVSSSPHNTPSPYGMSNFPHVRIGDDVRAQHRLVTEEFGIEELQLVLGWSMGSQQTWEWAVRYPEMVKRAMPIAGFAKNTDHDFLFAQTMVDAIKLDPEWKGGEYRHPHAVRNGLKFHAQLCAVTELRHEFYHYDNPGWKRFGSSSVEDFLIHFFESWFAPMDPNALICMGWKWQRGDVSRNTDGDLAAALGRITARTHVVAFAGEMLFPPEHVEREQRLVPNSQLRTIDSEWGHFGMLGIFDEDFQAVDGLIGELLSEKV